MERLSNVALGGIRNFRIADALAAGRRAGEKAIDANELRKVDAVLFERYLSALTEKDQRMANFLFGRFRPEFKVAAEAWLATDPLKNASAPPGPFIMKEYSLEVEKEARQLRQEEEKKHPDLWEPAIPTFLSVLYQVYAVVPTTVRLAFLHQRTPIMSSHTASL